MISHFGVDSTFDQRAKVKRAKGVRLGRRWNHEHDWRRNQFENEKNKSNLAGGDQTRRTASEGSERQIAVLVRWP